MKCTQRSAFQNPEAANATMEYDNSSYINFN